MHNNAWTQNGSHQTQFARVGHGDTANGQTSEYHRSISPQCMSFDNQLFPPKESYWWNEQTFEGKVDPEQIVKAKTLRYLPRDNNRVQLNLQVENNYLLEQIHPTPQTTSAQVVRSSNQSFLNSTSNKNMQKNDVQSNPPHWFLKPGVTGSEQFVTHNDSSHTSKKGIQQGIAQTTILGNGTIAKLPPPFPSIVSTPLSHSGTATTESSTLPINFNQSCNQRHLSGNNIKMIQSDPFPKSSNWMSPYKPFRNTQGITSNVQSGQCMPIPNISNGANTVHHTGNSSGNLMAGNAYTKQSSARSSGQNYTDKNNYSSLHRYRKQMAEKTSVTGHNSVNGSQGVISHSMPPLTTSYHSVPSSHQHIRDVSSSLNPVHQSYYVTVTEDKDGNGYTADQVMFLGKEKMFLQKDPQSLSSNKLLAGKISEQQLIVQAIPSTTSSVEVNNFSYQKSGITSEKAVAVVLPLSQTSNEAVGQFESLEKVCTTTEKPITNLNNHADLRENEHQSRYFSTKCSDSLLLRPKSSQSLNSCVSQIFNDKQCQVTQPPQMPAHDNMYDTGKGTPNIEGLSSVPVKQWSLNTIQKLIEEVEELEKSDKQHNDPDISIALKIFSMYWENSKDRLMAMIKSGAYQNVMAMVRDFSQKHIKLDTVILNSVISGQLDQLSDTCHVLQHDTVYPKKVYKSVWMNTNKQIDEIDKEFGFPWALKYGQKITVGEDELKLCKVNNGNPGNTGVMRSEVLSEVEKDSVDVNKAALPFQCNANTAQNEVLITDGREEELKRDEAEHGNVVCTVNRMLYEELTPSKRYEQPKLIETDDRIHPNTTEMQSKVETPSEMTPESDEDCETQASSVFHSFTETSFPQKTEMAKHSDDPFSSIEIHVLPPEEAIYFFGEALCPKKRENAQQNCINNSLETLPKSLHVNQLKMDNNMDDSMQEFCCLPRWMEANGVSGGHLLKTCQCRTMPGPTMPILSSPEKGVKETVAQENIHMIMPNYKLGLSAETKTRDNCVDAITATEHSQGEIQCTEIMALSSTSTGLSYSNMVEIDSVGLCSSKNAEMASAVQPTLDCGQNKQLDCSQKNVKHGQKQTTSLKKKKSRKSELNLGVKSCNSKSQLSEKISYLASLSLRQSYKPRNYPKTSNAFMNAKKEKKRKRLLECQSKTLSVNKTIMESKPTLELSLTGRHVDKRSHERTPPDDFEAVPCHVKTAKLALFGSLPHRKYGTEQTVCSNNLLSFQDTVFPNRPPLPPQILIVVAHNSNKAFSSDTVAKVNSPVKRRIFEEWKHSFVPTKKAKESQSAFKKGQVFRQGVLKKAKAKLPNKNNSPLKKVKRTKVEPEKSLKHIDKQLLFQGLKLRVEKSKISNSKSKKHISDTKSLYEMGSSALLPLQQKSCLRFSVLPKAFNFSDSRKPTESISVDESVKKSTKKKETSKRVWATDNEKGYFTPSSNTGKPTTSLFQEFKKKFTEKR